MSTAIRKDDSARAAPKPVGSSWFDDLGRLGTVEAMRQRMQEHNAFLAPDRLRRIAIVGAASEGERLVGLCQKNGIEIAALCDNDPAKHGTKIGGVAIQPLDVLAALEAGTPVIIASHRPLRAMERLREMGIRDHAQFMVLQCIAPERFPPHMFYDGWFEDLADNRARYAELFDALADDASRAHLDAVLGYRLTGRAEVLLPTVDWDVYAAKGVVALTDHEVYVEGGAYDGDTIRMFIDRVKGHYDQILGFEPDPKTYVRLKENFAGETRFRAIDKGLFSKQTTLRFSGDSSRAAILQDEGDIEVPVVSLDDEVDGGRVTFIKMNIEGAELEALNGARKTIEHWGPTLAISAYHRPTDLWNVPFRIRALRPSYRLFMRQHDVGVIETVAYGVDESRIPA